MEELPEVKIYKIKNICKNCGNNLQIEKWSEGGIRYSIVACSNGCFKSKPQKKLVPNLNIWVKYVNVGDKTYMINQDDNGIFYEAILENGKDKFGSYLKVKKIGGPINL